MSKKLDKLQTGSKIQIGDELNKIIDTVNENCDSINDISQLGTFFSPDQEYTVDEVISNITPSNVYSGMLIRYKDKEYGKVRCIMYAGPNGNEDNYKNKDNWDIISGSSTIDGGEW